MGKAKQLYVDQVEEAWYRGYKDGYNDRPKKNLDYYQNLIKDAKEAYDEGYDEGKHDYDMAHEQWWHE